MVVGLTVRSRFLAMLSLSMSLCACASDVRIRVANRSDVPMTTVIVQFPSQSETYGDIPAGASTEYRAVTEAYRYAYVEATVEDKRAIIQPIDFIGETLLSSGNYTYALTYQPDAETQFGRIRLELETD